MAISMAAEGYDPALANLELLRQRLREALYSKKARLARDHGALQAPARRAARVGEGAARVRARRAPERAPGGAWRSPGQPAAAPAGSPSVVDVDRGAGARRRGDRACPCLRAAPHHSGARDEAGRRRQGPRALALGERDVGLDAQAPRTAARKGQGRPPRRRGSRAPRRSGATHTRTPRRCTPSSSRRRRRPSPRPATRLPQQRRRSGPVASRPSDRGSRARHRRLARPGNTARRHGGPAASSKRPATERAAEATVAPVSGAGRAREDAPRPK